MCSSPPTEQPKQKVSSLLPLVKWRKAFQPCFWWSMPSWLKSYRSNMKKLLSISRTLQCIAFFMYTYIIQRPKLSCTRNNFGIWRFFSDYPVSGDKVSSAQFHLLYYFALKIWCLEKNENFQFNFFTCSIQLGVLHFLCHDGSLSPFFKCDIPSLLNFEFCHSLIVNVDGKNPFFFSFT